MQCYRHKNVETAVSCGKCDRPICPRCMIAGPAGMRCPDCSSLRSSTLYKVAPHRLLLAAVAGLAVGIFGGFIVAQMNFLVLLVGPLYGIAVAEAVLRSAGRKRGRVLEAIGIGSIVIGGVLAIGYDIAALTAAPDVPGEAARVGLAWLLPALAFPLLGIGLAISTCYSRLKYF